jgi:hypothetical protein
MAYAPTIKDVFAALKQILNVLTRPLWMNETTGAIRQIDNIAAGAITASIAASQTLATVTTVSTVTTLTQIGGIAAYDSLLIIPMRQNWQLSVRNKIT